jgi:hypothetical protein
MILVKISLYFGQPGPEISFPYVRVFLVVLKDFR